MEIITNRIGIPGAVESLIGGRNENQDDFGFAETALGMLVVVCDGMGGGPAGRTASGLACETIIRQLKTAKMNDDPETVLYNAVIAANNALLGAIAAKPDLQGMGTTCVCLLVNHKYAYIAHVGDSRCYQLRNGQYVFRTADHSYVAELVRHKTITEEEARQSRYSNVITRAIGVGQELEPEIDKVSVKSGDRFALMTDGIWGSMCEKDLVRYFVKEEDMESLVSGMARVVDQIGVDEGGGHDNLTLAMVQLPADVKSQPQPVVQTLNEKLAQQQQVQKPIQQPVKKEQASQPVKQQTAATTPDKGSTPATEQDVHITITELADEGAARRKNIWIVILSILLVAVIGVLVWLLWPKGDDKTADEDDKYTTIDNRSRTDNKDPEQKWEDNYKDRGTSSVQDNGVRKTTQEMDVVDNVKKINDNKNSVGDSKEDPNVQPQSTTQSNLNSIPNQNLTQNQKIILESAQKLRKIIEDYHNAKPCVIGNDEWTARQESIRKILKQVSAETKKALGVGNSAAVNSDLRKQIEEINTLSKKKLLDDNYGRPDWDTEKALKKISNNLIKISGTK